jgi:trk system potassium uptake protein TrkH
MARYATVLNLVSVVVVIFALAMLLPLAVSLTLEDGAEGAYDLAILATGLAGCLGWVLTRGGRRELQPRDGFLFVVLVWSVLPAFATLPLLVYLPWLGFTDA